MASNENHDLRHFVNLPFNQNLKHFRFSGIFEIFNPRVDNNGQLRIRGLKIVFVFICVVNCVNCVFCDIIAISSKGVK